MSLPRASTLLTSRLIRAACLLGLAGCADQPSEYAESPSREEGSALQQQVTGPSFEIVAATAHGSGCPAGTWSYQRIPGTNEFRADFRAFRIEVTPQQGLGSIDCQLQFNLRSEVPVRYRVARALTQGGAGLAPQQSARHSLRAYLMQGTASTETVQRVSGPYDGILQIVVPSNSYASRCSAEQTLNVGTRVLLTNDGVGSAIAVMPVVMFQLDPAAC